MTSNKSNSGSLSSLVGLCYGDEGKGKIVHGLASEHDVVVRFHGGPNAGHTIIIDDKEIVLNTIPCGIFSTTSFCGDDMVINPILLKQEIEKVIANGGDIEKNLFLAQGIHLIIPTHIMLDKAEENFLGKSKIGSTLQGMAPVYRDKVGRKGLRLGDIFRADFEERFWKLASFHKNQIENVYNYDFEESTDIIPQANEFLGAVEYLRQFKNKIVHGPTFLNKYLKEGKKILAEGAQASMLDSLLGTYPYVTSSRTLASAAPSALGLPASSLTRVIGVIKAYTTRVGSGPFPTEIGGKDSSEWVRTHTRSDEESLAYDVNDNDPVKQGIGLRLLGHEYGARTGRPRNTGWLSLPEVRYAAMINGTTEIVMTKLDIFDSFDEIKVCTHYIVDGTERSILDFDLSCPETDVEPVYTTFPGWKGKSTREIKNYDDLPANAKVYLNFISDQIGVPITMISVGPCKDDLVIR
jgi:adenylosuccinate synthase